MNAQTEQDRDRGENEALALLVGRKYSIDYVCRYGVGEGNDVFTYLGIETLGKRILEPTNGGPPIYLFDDEIRDAEPWT